MISEKTKEATMGAVAGAIDIRGLRVTYGRNEALHGIDLTVDPGTVLAIVGPSGCGKTTLLRCLNRMTPLGCKVEGHIGLDGDDIHLMDAVLLRRRVGMVFQKPNPFPMSVRENVLYGVRAQGGRRSTFSDIVESSLKAAALWDQVKSRLDDSALALSVGQQQRLCIARSLAVQPEVLLMDEPAASLDPGSTAAIEATIAEMKGTYTVLVVTHDIEQARRLSDKTVHLDNGVVVEAGATADMFGAARTQATREYLAGRTAVAEPVK